MKTLIINFIVVFALLSGCTLTPEQQERLNRAPDPGATLTGTTVTESGIVCRYSDGTSRVLSNRGASCF